jgi:hypothetical protein
VLKVMAESGPAVVIVALGVASIIALTAIAFMRAHGLQRTAAKLVELALGGRADQARIHARNANRDLRPLLDALGGELSRPRRAPLLKDGLLLALIPAPTAILFLYGLTHIAGQADNKLSIAAAFLLGMGILIPLSFAGALAIIALRGYSGRMVRGSYITLLARNVRTAIDSEQAEALRRSSPRDPRGE